MICLFLWFFCTMPENGFFLLLQGFSDCHVMRKESKRAGTMPVFLMYKELP